MADNEITTGTSPTCFSPNDPVTRGQAAAFMWRMEGFQAPGAPHPFVDVFKDWQQDPVSWMFFRGITTGTSNTTYSPEDVLTRGQLAALLWRLAGSPGGNPPHPFTDVVKDWQVEAISWMSSLGITTGTSPTLYSPDDYVTRGQLATFFHRYKGRPPVAIDPTHPTSPPCPDQVTDPTLRFVTGVSERTLVDQFGSPLYLVADAGWSLIGALPRSEISRYLDLVVDRGHNAVWLSLVENAFSSNPPFAAEPSAGAPFTGSMFTSSPRDAYWDHVDWVIDQMALRGLTAFVNPAYVGFVDEHGVGAEMVSASTADMRRYGAFLGARYASAPNVVYQIGGDRDFDPASAVGVRYAALAEGVLGQDPSALITVMTGPDAYSSAMWGPDWLGFESVYENDSADLALLDVWSSTSLPLVFAEPAFEGSRFPDTGWSRLYGRRQLYVSFGYGYTGVVPGNCLRWHFEEDPIGVGCSAWGTAGWAETLVDPSGDRGPGGGPADQHAADTQRFTVLLESLPWPGMDPDVDGSFLTSGQFVGVDRAAARVGDGVGFVYLPSWRDVTVDTTLIAGRVSIRWYDPTSGAYVLVQQDEAADPGRVVTHPGPNAAGDTDWVLLIMAA